jgi:hypothetical protein
MRKWVRGERIGASGILEFSAGGHSGVVCEFVGATVLKATVLKATVSEERSSPYWKQPFFLLHSGRWFFYARFFYAIAFNKYLIILKVLVISCPRSNLPSKLPLDCKTYYKKCISGYTSYLCLHKSY